MILTWNNEFIGIWAVTSSVDHCLRSLAIYSIWNTCTLFLWVLVDFFNFVEMFVCCLWIFYLFRCLKDEWLLVKNIRRDYCCGPHFIIVSLWNRKMRHLKCVLILTGNNKLIGIWTITSSVDPCLRPLAIWSVCQTCTFFHCLILSWFFCICIFICCSDDCVLRLYWRDNFCNVFLYLNNVLALWVFVVYCWPFHYY